MACARQVANTPQSTRVYPVETVIADHSRVWLGADWWANRLQDWSRDKAHIVCSPDGDDLEGRTAHCLTRSITELAAPTRISVLVSKRGQVNEGLAGLLIGAGGGLDYRSASLIQRFSGEGGGLLAVIDQNGAPSIRAFDDPEDVVDYANFGYSPQTAGRTDFSSELLLSLEVLPRGDLRCDLRMCVSDAVSGAEIGCAVAPDVAVSRVIGNLALFASSGSADQQSGWAFSGLSTGGGISEHPERALGPVMACLHSLNRDVLKMTAQLMPVSTAQLPQLLLVCESSTGDSRRALSDVGDGFAAQFRMEGWDPESDHTYSIYDPRKPDAAIFEGTIQADPGASRPLSIALHSCLLPTARSLDEANYKPRIPQETAFGRYSPDNIVFPHAEMTARCEAQQPDLYVFAGDQYYETFPTRRGHDGPNALLDTLYRWYLFLWTFREPLRNKPAIVLADDHDVLQGNLWGNEGENSELPREEDGGFKHDKQLVRTIYRMQTGHNPDPWDARSIDHRIPVSFGHFVYGGTSFAFVEDRKFKDPPQTEIAPEKTRGELLGERQEAFLSAWAGMDEGLPKVCLTASIWGSPQTAGNLKPLLDYDSNGYPPDGRNRAVRLLKDTGAIALAGDQHLAMIAIQGIDAPDDGPLFFAGPAGAAFWQRWFEGLGKLPNQRAGDPDTGDFVDCFGHPMRVLAVANPKIGYESFMAAKDFWGNFVADHRLKSEGFGIVRVDSDKKEFTFECWPRTADSGVDGQFPGWPYVHPFPNTL